MATTGDERRAKRFHSPQSTAAPAEEPAARRRTSAFGAFSLLLFSLLISVAGGLLAFFEISYRDRIYPGIRVEPLELGGMTRAQARQALSTLYDNADPWWPILTYGEKVWLPSQDDLGIQVDIDASVQEAYAFGRSENLLGALSQQWSAYRGGHTVRPVVRVDMVQARRYLSAIADEINRPVREATLHVAGTQVELIPSQAGLQVDEEATLEQLVARISNWEGGEVPLVVREIKPLITNLDGLAERVQRILSSPLELQGPADLPANRWLLYPEELAKMLILEQRMESDGTVAGVAALSPAALRARVEEIAAHIDRPPKDGRIDYDLNLNQLVVVESSQIGYRLDIDRTVSLIQDHALSQDREIPLPVEILTPTIDTDNLEALGIETILAKGTTNFQGSSRDRMTNIELATKRFDGILLAPREIFSFNKYLGEVTAEEGFQDSLIIWGDRTAVGIGGGICQVSTTAFRAAFWAGLEILERWAHGYRVSWYEPPVGLDATVYSPSVDFKFRNDTPGYLLIKTETDLVNGTVTFYLIGTDTGREVEMIGPIEENATPPGPAEYRDDPSLPEGTVKQVEWPVGGLDVTIKRIVRQGGKVLYEDVFFSRYRPWNAVYLVGTGGAPAGGEAGQ